MAGVVFWFENNDRDVFSGRKVHLDAWRYAMGAADISEARCFNISNYDAKELRAANTNYEMAGTTKEEFVDWVIQHQDENLVFIETEWSCPSGAISLKQLDHKAVDWYLFGAVKGFPAKCYDFGRWVYLPVKDRFALHPVHIASCVLLRRYEELR